MQVDEERIKDPNAVKPEDWDEDAPKTIPDEEAVMPSGWLSDEPLTVRGIATRERHAHTSRGSPCIILRFPIVLRRAVTFPCQLLYPSSPTCVR